MNKDLVELIEKIGRLKLLVGKIPKHEHTNCPAREGYGSCTCKAGPFNEAVRAVKEELGLEQW